MENGQRSSVVLFTDGACSGNPGAGGYCAILQCRGNERVISGYRRNTTNNRMELIAVIEGLKTLEVPCNVHVISDSKYVCDAVNQGWIRNWKRNGWRKSDKKPVLNIDLWTEFDRLISIHDVEFEWVKGHAGHPENERCDRIAVEEYMNRKGENE